MAVQGVSPLALEGKSAWRSPVHLPTMWATRQTAWNVWVLWGDGLWVALYRLPWTHVFIKNDSVNWGSCIDIKYFPTPHSPPWEQPRDPEFSTQDIPSYWFPCCSDGPSCGSLHMATAQVCPGLLLFFHLLPTLGGEGQGVEAHSSLGLDCVDLLPEDHLWFFREEYKRW